MITDNKIELLSGWVSESDVAPAPDAGRIGRKETVNGGDGVPKCECGVVVRPDVVLYEESLDRALMAKSVEFIRRADVLIVGGTSLNVYPAAGLIDYYRGRKLVLINRSPKPFNSAAGLLIAEKIGEVFARI